MPDRLDRLPKVFSPAILQIISRDGRDHHMLESEAMRRFGHPPRFICLQCVRPCRRDRAKTAGARAAVSRDHERSGSFAPTFPMIRTAGAFANRVKIQLLK